MSDDALDVTCPCCGESWQMLTPRAMDEAAGYMLDHKAMQTVVFYTAADLLRVAEAARDRCVEAVVSIGPAPLRGTYDNGVDDSADAVRAVDVAEVVRRVTKP